jgi:hypothetical protein
MKGAPSPGRQIAHGAQLTTRRAAPHQASRRGQTGTGTGTPLWVGCGLHYMGSQRRWAWPPSTLFGSRHSRVGEQTELAQQICPRAPHARQVPSPGPSSTQRFPGRQAAPSPVQQGWLGPPHVRQTGAAPGMGSTQAAPSWQLFPGQQAALLAPQLVHVPTPAPGSLQPDPMLQVDPWQQAWLRAPQGWQAEAIPAAASMQRRLSAHAPPPPEQQGWPAPPQTPQRSAPWPGMSMQRRGAVQAVAP